MNRPLRTSSVLHCPACVSSAAAQDGGDFEGAIRARRAAVMGALAAGADAGDRGGCGSLGPGR